MKNPLKPMIYKTKPEYTTLAHGIYRGYEYAIISLGKHPCAYVGVPKGHPLYGKEYDSKNFPDIKCHFGITYSRNGLGGIKEQFVIYKSQWVIGWDYAHCTDFSGSYLNFGGEMFGKAWTTEEILEEVHNVISQLISLYPGWESDLSYQFVNEEKEDDNELDQD